MHGAKYDVGNMLLQGVAAVGGGMVAAYVSDAAKSVLPNNKTRLGILTVIGIGLTASMRDDIGRAAALGVTTASGMGFAANLIGAGSPTLNGTTDMQRRLIAAIKQGKGRFDNRMQTALPPSLNSSLPGTLNAAFNGYDHQGSGFTLM